MKSELKALRNILLSPFLILMSKTLAFLDRKSPSLEITLTFCDFNCYGEIKPLSIHNEQLLIGSYLCFLARYFYICDERQIQPMREVLKMGAARDQLRTVEFQDEITSTVLNTFNPDEKRAFHGLFHAPLIPPTFYSEDRPSGRRVLGKYLFRVFENENGEMTSTFHMSVGGDIYLLPKSVGFMYYAVERRLSESARARLNVGIGALLLMHAVVDCRSQAALVESPREVLAQAMEYKTKQSLKSS